jgi:hypothetical protein
MSVLARLVSSSKAIAKVFLAAAVAADADDNSSAEAMSVLARLVSSSKAIAKVFLAAAVAADAFFTVASALSKEALAEVTAATDVFAFCSKDRSSGAVRKAKTTRADAIMIIVSVTLVSWVKKLLNMT